VLEVRTQGEPLAYANTLRAIARQLHPEVRLTAIRTQAANTDRTISREILFARLSNTFALLALVIACAGLYGTVSYAMARQTPRPAFAWRSVRRAGSFFVTRCAKCSAWDLPAWASACRQPYSRLATSRRFCGAWLRTIR
jgi:hypothetical protein